MRSTEHQRFVVVIIKIMEVMIKLMKLTRMIAEMMKE